MTHQLVLLSPVGRPWHAVAALLVLLALSHQAAALPQQFVANIARTNCTAHPDQGHGAHRDPVPDRSITVNFTPTNRTAAGTGASPSALCAGSTYIIYNLEIGFGGAWRNALVTASSGSLTADGGPLASAASSVTDGRLANAVSAVTDGRPVSEALGLLDLYSEECPGRHVTPLLTNRISLTLELPEDAPGSLEVKVTSASGPIDNYRTATATIPVLTQQRCNSSTARFNSTTVLPEAGPQVEPSGPINATVAPPVRVAAAAGPPDGGSVSPIAANGSGAGGNTSTGGAAGGVVASGAAARMAGGWGLVLSVIVVVCAVHFGVSF